MRDEQVSAPAPVASLMMLCVVAWLAGGPADAQEPEAIAEQEDASPAWVFEIDPEASSVTFELGATLHTVEGAAEVRDGSVRFDPARGTASGRIDIAAQSLDTGNENRDEDMHQKVLESAQYPEIYFEAERMSGAFEPEGQSRVTLEGAFGIHGDEHPTSLIFDVRVEGERLTASTEFEVPYVEWGMEDPSRFLLRVEKHVTVVIEAVGTLSKEESGVSSDAAEAASEGGSAHSRADLSLEIGILALIF